MSEQTKTPAAGRGKEGARARAGLRALALYRVARRTAYRASAAIVGALAGAALAEIAVGIGRALL